MKARFNINRLRHQVAAATLAVMVVAGSLVLAASASALSKHVFASSFPGSGPTALTNPSDVAFDPTGGDVYVANTPEDTRQSLKVDATGGTFTLTFKGQTTAPLPFNASPGRGEYSETPPGSIEAALAELPAIGSGNVHVFPSKAFGSVIYFTGPLGDSEQPQLIADTSHLTGGAAAVHINTLIPGSGAADIEKFTSSGEFVYIAGKNVDRTKVDEASSSEAERNLCTAASADSCQPGTPGSQPGAFKGFGHLYLAIDSSTGDLYIGDPGSGLVTKLDSAGQLVSGWGEGGQLDGSTAGLYGPFRLLEENDFFDTIGGVGVRPDGSLLVQRGLATSGAQLFHFAPDGAYLGKEETGHEETSESRIASGGALDLATGERYFVEQRELDDPMVVSHYAPSGGLFETFGEGELTVPQGAALDPATGNVYVADSGNRRIVIFASVPYLPDAIPSATNLTPHSEELEGEVERAGAGEISGCFFEYGKSRSYTSGPLPCFADPPSSLPYSAESTSVSAEVTGLEYATTYHFHLVVENINGKNASFDDTFTTLPLAPTIEAVTGQAFAESALLHTTINPGGGPTTFRVEYVDQHTFETENGFEHPQRTVELDASSARTPQQLLAHLDHLTPATTYHYRLVATNASSPSGGTVGAEHVFTTLPFVSEPPEACANAHVRQQTSAAQLLDCRAYELVSASDAAGYDVESDVIAGQQPFAGYPQADGRVLYGVHSGGIPGTNHPTGRGLDPYVAVRGETGWSTEYVGVPANEPFSAAPYSSTPSGADANLETFAFGAPGGCSPCFPGGFTGIPLHRSTDDPNGELVQGMAGPENPGSSAKADGYVVKELSANGEHFIFGSTSLFAPGGNDSDGDVSIYDRNLATGQTHVVSNQPGTEDFPEALECLQGDGECDAAEGDANGIAELDVSSNGSRVLLGQKVSEDADGHPYWHLYMEVDDGVSSIDLTPGVISEPGGPGSSEGVLYDGMTSDGSKVFFTTKDALTSEDEDTSADIYRADVTESSATLASVSSHGAAGEPGNSDSCDPAPNTVHEHWNTIGSEGNCGVLAVGGGGGVSSANGSIYFLSPEQLEASQGTENAPNLYVARPTDGYQPHYISTLESSANAPLPPAEHHFQRAFGHFEAPTGVAVSEHPGEKGDVYVLDLTNQEAKGNVRKFDPAGNLVTSFGTGGKITGSPPFAEAASATLPSSLAVDNDPTSQSYGDLYVVNTQEEVVEKFSPSGAPLGNLNVGFPSAIAINQATGEVFVTEAFGGIHIFDDEGTELPGFAALFAPTGVAVAPDGTVYVVNGGGFNGEPGEAEAYDSSGTPLHSLPAAKALGVAVDPETEHAYVDEGDRVAEFDASGNQAGALTGSGRLVGSIGLAAYAGELYVSSRGAGPTTGVVDVFDPAQLPPDRATDSQLVIDSVSSPATRHTADFQTTPTGGLAVFSSTLGLAANGEEPNGHTEIFRYDAGAEDLACISCTLSGFPSDGDSSLAANGLSLTDDGRVFFDSDDPLLAADTDEKRDVYEWEPAGSGNCSHTSPSFTDGVCLALVSAGTSSFDSGLLSASSDASDAYFFTRDSLTPADENGPTMKIYDARAEGGFPFTFPAVTCRASDECHGAASPAPGPLKVGSGTVIPPTEVTKGCKKGFVKKQGKCVKKRKPHKHRHHKHGSHHRGGSK